MEKKEKTNILVISVGMALIFLIGLFFLIKPLINKKNNSEIKSANDEALIESLKKAKKITSEDLRRKLLIEKNAPIVIDVRDEISFAQEHILDSLNIPYPNIQEAMDFFEKDKLYVLVDDGSSFQAAYATGGIFYTNSFPNVFYLEGGFIAWKNKTNFTISAGDPLSFIDQSKVTYINSDDLKKIIETEDNFYVIDVREKNNYDLGHIKNAVNIPLNDIEKKRREIPKGKKIVLCDEDGFLAFQAGVRLYDLGLFNTRVLSDGLKTWSEKGYEIIK